MSKKPEILTTYLPKILLLKIHAPYNRTASITSYFEEFDSLIKTNGTHYHHELCIKLRTIDSAYFLTSGKLAELKDFCQMHGIEEIVVSEQLTGLQERNLEDHLDVRIYDRTHLILEIFEKSAHTAEGKLQVTIALLEFQKTRLSGKSLHLSQQSGHIGVRAGAGESAKEKESRHIRSSILKLKKQLARAQNTRATQRKKRLADKVPHVCLVGYTNAGKSTILNLLTKSHVLAEDKLFATLDTTTRELYIDGKKKGIISDTVGFIQQLPHQLVDAFKSTLQELEYADLLIHVIDASDPNWESHIKVVNKILLDLDIDKPMLYVFNKSDAALDDNRLMWELYQPNVTTSALSKEGVQALIQFLKNWDIKR